MCIAILRTVRFGFTPAKAGDSLTHLPRPSFLLAIAFFAAASNDRIV